MFELKMVASGKMYLVRNYQFDASNKIEIEIIPWNPSTSKLFEKLCENIIKRLWVVWQLFFNLRLTFVAIYINTTQIITILQKSCTISSTTIEIHKIENILFLKQYQFFHLYDRILYLPEPHPWECGYYLLKKWIMQSFHLFLLSLF